MVIWWRPPLRAGSFEEERTQPDVDWRPDLDIYESEEQYLLVFDLPGVRPDELDVLLNGQTLSVGGLRRAALPSGTVAHLLEGPHGSFERRIRLPPTADPTQMRTELRHGQLVILIAKRPSAMVRIQIGVQER